MQNADQLTVFYDGGCPLCDREIAFYKRRRGAGRLAWIDLSQVEQDTIIPGLSKQQALARFHVLTADGHLVSGGAAFAALWVVLPGFRLVGLVCQLSPMTWILDRAYPLFLKLRPSLQALAPRRRRE